MMADIAYVPNPGGCGCSPGQRYVRALRERLHKALEGHTPGLVPASKRILVIQRTGGSRSLLNHDELVVGLQKHFPHASVDVFKDNPPPAVSELARMFFSAKVIIAPHGAGLSNILLATSKAVVIEVLIPPVVTCYVDLARELGNDWYGVYGNAHSEAPMRVNVDEVLTLTQKVL
jgi:hypothetical protein